MVETPVPVARSPVAPAPPITVAHGWEVSDRHSAADLTITDCTPLAKVLVRADPPHTGAATEAPPLGRAARTGGYLLVGSAPGEWLALGPPGSAPEIAAWAEGWGDRLGAGLVSVFDVTSARVLLRLTGSASAAVLAKVCAIDLGDHVTPDGTAFRTSVAKVATDVIRDDRGGPRSYLASCEWSSGQYLFDTLMDPGEEFGIDVDGFVAPGL